MTELRDALGELETAEEFLDHFGIAYDPRIVRVCRLHILKRAHDYLSAAEIPGESDAELSERFRGMLERAYADFVQSEPLKERVFKVLRDAEARPAERRAFVPLSAITGPARAKGD